MKYTKNIWLQLLLILSMSVVLFSCSDDDAEVNASNIKLNVESIILEVGETIQLEATIEPSNATIQRYGFTSKNPNVAEVTTAGLVTAKGRGKTTITVVTPRNGLTATVEVTVNGTELPPTMQIAGTYNGIVKMAGTPVANNVVLKLKRVSDFKVSLTTSVSVPMLPVPLSVHGDDLTIVETGGIVKVSGKAITDNFGFGDKETTIDGTIDEEGNILLNIKIDSIDEPIEYIGKLEPEVILPITGNYVGEIIFGQTSLGDKFVVAIEKLSDTKMKIETSVQTPLTPTPLHVHGSDLNITEVDGIITISGKAITDDFGYGDKETIIDGTIDKEGNINLNLKIESLSEDIKFKGVYKEVELGNITGDYKGEIIFAGSALGNDFIVAIEKLSDTKIKIETTASIQMLPVPLHVHGDDLSITVTDGITTISGKAIADDYGYGDKETTVSGTIDKAGNMELSLKVASIDEPIEYKGKKQ